MLYNHHIIDYNRLKGVRVYLESYTKRIPVGELTQEQDKYIFVYYKTYLRYKKAIPLGIELPLTKPRFESYKIFESLFEPFGDRIPKRRNLIHLEYCKHYGINPDENSIKRLLAIIGRRGQSSFIFEPIEHDSFCGKELKAFRENLSLSTHKFATAFGISQATIVRIENNKTSGAEVMKFLEILDKFPEVAIYCVEKYGVKLHSKVKNKLIDVLMERVFLKIKKTL